MNELGPHLSLFLLRSHRWQLIRREGTGQEQPVTVAGTSQPPTPPQRARRTGMGGMGEGWRGVRGGVGGGVGGGW